MHKLRDNFICGFDTYEYDGCLIHNGEYIYVNMRANYS